MKPSPKINVFIRPEVEIAELRKHSLSYYQPLGFGLMVNQFMKKVE